MLHPVEEHRRTPSRGAAPRPPRRPLPLAGTLLAVAMAAAGFWWLSGHHTVALVVDGRVTTHETHAATVGEFLERASVEVGEADTVTPAPGTRLRDGMRVEVVRAREVTLLIGEEQRQVVVTALTVDELLDTLGADELRGDAGPRRLVRPSRLSRVRSGMVVELSDPLALTVVHDGRRKEVVTTQRTVAGLLDRLGIAVGARDRVVPALDHPLEHGLVVAVERVTVDQAVREEVVGYGTVERATDALPLGHRRVARAGRAGRVEVVERVVRVDGDEAERRVVDERVVAAPVDQVLEVGTGAPAATGEPAAAGGDAPAGSASAEPGDDGEQEEPPPADQEAEAGGAAGETPGEDAAPAPAEAPAQVQEGLASWYRNPYGAYTAAHRTIPRGTVVTVTNVADGRSVQVRINDRGPFVAGRVIDLDRRAFAEIAPPSRGVVQVRIEW